VHREEAEGAAGKALSRILKCHMVAKARSQPVDVTCVANASAKLGLEVTKPGTVCPGDASALDPLVTACVADAPGDGLCPGTSTKCVGKATGSQMVCSMKDLSKPGSLGACSAKTMRSCSSA
jgi:hypothetical protein